MAGGKAAFLEKNGDTLEWLLEESDPSVRLYSLRWLLGRGEGDAEVVVAREALMRSGPVAEILSRQSEGGYWGEGPDFYRAKYRGSSWQLLVLAELGADPGDARVRAACEYILAHSQEPESGGFSVDPAAGGGGRRGMVIPCLTGNMAFSLLRLGFGEDPRVAKAIGWICEHQRADDGVAAPPKGWPYDGLEPCYGRHSCFMGVVKSLKALAAIPSKRRGKLVKTKIAELAEFLLVHRVHKRSHEPAAVSRPGWLRLGFPLMYQTDILEILCVLAELGFRDERMAEARDVLASKRGADGRWKLESSFNGKTLVDIERKGGASKWITARAIYALDAATPGSSASTSRS
jgi:hypothetical protein